MKISLFLIHNRHKKNINTSGLDSSIVIKINIMFKFGPDANIDIHILTIILIWIFVKIKWIINSSSQEKLY